jgi:hypothetical protein
MLYLTPRVGLEPTSENSKPAVDNALTENKNPVLSASLDKTLQKPPKIDTLKLSSDLVQIVQIWPELPEHIKAAIKALVESHSKEAKVQTKDDEL